MLRNRKRAGRKLGIANGQTRDDVLRLIAHGHGTRTLEELGTLLEVTGETISYHIRGLAGDGLVRVLDNGVIILTDAGADAFNSLEGAA